MIVVISTLVAVILFMVGFFYIFAMQFVTGGIMMVLAMAVMVVGRKKFKSKEDLRNEEYLEKYPNVGFLRIPYAYSGKRTIDFKIIAGPIGTDDLETTKSNVLYPTYFMPVGEYTLEATFVEKRIENHLFQDKEERVPKTFNVQVENKKFYVLDYDDAFYTYNFTEYEVPKELDTIMKVLNKQ